MGRFSFASSNVLARRRISLPLGMGVALWLVGLNSSNAGAAPPALPGVNLIVQIRVISDTELAADEAALHAPSPGSPRELSISSAVDEPASARTQELRVRNGEHASISWSQAVPIQWLQAAERRGTAASAAGGGIVNALVWLRAGHALTVQPSWPGARRPVRVSLSVETERIGDRQAQEIPSSSLQTSSATLSVPLGQWTTFAAAGTVQPPPDSSTWSTQSPNSRGRQLMQLRVTPD